ncbi:MAG: YiiD C-terminal domain-containing protein [Melioribacteraceae bacterium]|nr:YiiD C-terminal domain-containing protein [Melioribacteraceae bacterium]
MFIKKEEVSKQTEKFAADAKKLNEYILSNIPILSSVNLSVTDLTEDSIKLSAPLYENRNHYGSAFGGSIATIGIVAGWAILTYKIKEEKVPATFGN